MHRIVFNSNDNAANPTLSHHLVAGLQIVDHRLPALLLALLGKNQQKVKNAEDKKQGQSQSKTAALAAELKQKYAKFVLYHF